MSVQSIKKSQKESLLFRAIAQLFAQTTLDEKRLQGIAVSRVKLSDDKGVATVYFYAPGGMAEFKEKLSTIVLYKNSLRRALAQSINSRYTPELIFKFDDQYEKQQRLEGILEQIKGDDSSESSD
jgi:ribosome-binding factor A